MLFECSGIQGILTGKKNFEKLPYNALVLQALTRSVLAVLNQYYGLKRHSSLQIIYLIPILGTIALFESHSFEITRRKQFSQTDDDQS